MLNPDAVISEVNMLLRPIPRHVGARSAQARGGATPLGTVPPGNAFFLHVERRGPPQELGVVLTLAPGSGGVTPDLEWLRAWASRRVSHVPMMAMKLAYPRSAAAPVWTSEPRVDVVEHVRQCRLGRLDAPRTLGEAVDEFFGHPLDRGRPLWELLLVHGLDGGRTAVCFKFHHALGDGVALLRVLADMITADDVDAGNGRQRDGVRSYGSTGPASQDRAEPPEPPEPPARALLAAPRAAALRVVRACAAAVRTSLTATRGLWSLAWQGTAPPDPFPRDGATGVRYLLVPLPAVSIRSAARALRVSRSDLLLTLAADTAHRVLTKNGSDTQGMTVRVMVPRMVRPAAGGLRDSRTGTISVDVPVGPMEPRVRLAAVHAAFAARVASGQPQAAQLVMRAVGSLLPARLHAWFARATYRGTWFNLMVTLLPGPLRARTLAGIPIEAAYPIVPPAPEVCLMVGMVIWGRIAACGISLERAAFPDSDAFERELRNAFEELCYTVED